MPLEELLKLYNYGGAAVGAPAPTDGEALSESAPKKSGSGQERLRDVRPDKTRQDKNGVSGSKAKTAEVTLFFCVFISGKWQSIWR